ncbi:hypothetical protein MD484_g8290, partial [Candolleomyces efflorescens]
MTGTTNTTLGQLVEATSPRTILPPLVCTLAQVVTALESVGVTLEKPAAVYGLPGDSAAILNVNRVCDAIEDHTWSILHSGASDLVVAGPASKVPIPELVEAIVRAREDPAESSEGQERPGRYAGGFSCLKCGHWNMLRSGGAAPSSERWYAVVAGLEVGVFQGSAIANSHTLNVSGSSQQSYSTRAEADAAFERAMAAGIVKKIVPGEARIVS